MSDNFPSHPHYHSNEKTTSVLKDVSPSAKLPRLILEDIFAFPPNRETLGGTAYLIFSSDGNILIDCPRWNEINQQFCQQQGGVKWLFLTHRGGIGKQVGQIQQNLGCQVLIQEQEAYLLPNLEVISFEQEFRLNPECEVIWTPGHSPGSACLYYARHGGVLYTGRHLLPSREGKPIPLPMRKTFHWGRQLRSVKLLGDRFSADTLSYICPGANTGYLRGFGYISNAYEGLLELDWEQLKYNQGLG